MKDRFYIIKDNKIQFLQNIDISNTQRFWLCVLLMCLYRYLWIIINEGKV